MGFRTHIAFSFLALGLVSCTTPGLNSNTDSKETSPQSSYSGYGAESVRRETLAEFAPPPLDPDTTQMIQSMLELRAPGMGLLTPDKKTMYFGWNISGTPQIWKLDRPLGFPIQYTSGTDRTQLSDVTADGRYLVLSRDRAGEENPGLYLQPVGGGPLIQIQHKKGVRTHLAWSTRDGKTIFYTANDIQPDSYALYSYSIREGKKELLFSEPGLWFVADVEDDKRFLLAKATGSLSREYYEWDLKDKKLKPVIGQGETEEYQVRFAKDRNEYFVVTPKFGEFRRLYKLKEGQLSALTPEVKKDVESFRVDMPRRRLYIGWNDNGYSRVEVRDATTFQELKLPVFKDADHIYVGEISRDGQTVTIGVETSLSPRSSYVFDWRSGRLVQWVRPSLPEVDTSRFAKTDLEHYPARDGTKIPMLVTRPATCANNPCPVVVNFHGGPESQSRPGFDRLAQIYASAGFVFVRPNVRGSDGYGKSWLRADDGPRRLDVITDIEDCARYIKNHWAKDGAVPKIGVMGGSYGGYSTLMAMSRFAGAYDAGVAYVGMSNLRTFLLNTAPYRRSLRVSEYGDPEKDKEALEKLSPTTYLDRIRDPLMIIQGVSDPRVPVGEAIQMHELLKKKGVKSPLILFADEGHGSVKLGNQVLQHGHTLNFFKENLTK